MEIFVLREKKLSDFNIYYFQLCFLYISVLRNLYNKARTCVDATNLQRRDLDGLGSRTLDLNRLKMNLTAAWQEHVVIHVNIAETYLDIKDELVFLVSSP